MMFAERKFSHAQISSVAEEVHHLKQNGLFDVADEIGAQITIARADIRGALSFNTCIKAYLPSAPQDVIDGLKACFGKNWNELKKCLLDKATGIGINIFAKIYCCTEATNFTNPCSKIKNKTQCQDCCSFNTCKATLKITSVLELIGIDKRDEACKLKCDCDY